MTITLYANGSGLATTADGAYIAALPVGLCAEAGELVPLATPYNCVLITGLSGGRLFETGPSFGRRSAQMVLK